MEIVKRSRTKRCNLFLTLQIEFIYRPNSNIPNSSKRELETHAEQTEQSSSISPESDSGSPSLSGARDVRLENLLCSDADYTTAELVPAIQTTCQKQLLFTRLNNEFEHHTLIKEAGCIGISRRTAMRWNNAWQDEGLITKLSHGLYKKIS